LRYFFSPYHQSSALYPGISQLGHEARFERDDDAAARRVRKVAKLDTLLARTSTAPEDAALIADLLSLPAASRYPPLDLTPQQRKNKTLQALVRRLQALADAQPVLMVFEDAHWSDPSSREFRDLVIERIQALPALLVVTFRPEFEPPWTGQSRVSTLVLNQLDRQDGATLVNRIVSDETLSEEVVEDIVKRADGVPLFLEELTKLVLEIQLRPEDPVPMLATTPSTGLARISHAKKCIGAPNQRKLLCGNDFPKIRGRPDDDRL
jgi:predicted ATPase